MKIKYRDRKNKGTLSVLDEPAIIEYTPNLALEQINTIKQQTELVDASFEKRKESISTAKEYISDDTKSTSSDIDSKFDTVSNYKKMTPSLLEVLALKEMAKKLNNGVSTFQTNEIAKKIGTTLGGARNAINRLKNKGLITNVGFQAGNQIGFTSFKMNSKCFDYLAEFLDKKESVSTDTVSTDTVSKSISQYSKKEEYNLLTEELKSIGIKQEHLSAFSGTKEELQSLIAHFSFSIQSNEIKVSQKMALFLSLLRDKKPWVSQSLILKQEQELKDLNQRVETLKKLKQEELKKKFELFVLENPSYLKKVKEQTNFTVSPEVLNQIAFSTWQESENKET